MWLVVCFDSYKADVVFKLEDNPWNIWEFFDGLGVPEAQLSKLVLLPNINVSTYAPANDQNLRRVVMNAERDFCEAYEYYW